MTTNKAVHRLQEAVKRCNTSPFYMRLVLHEFGIAVRASCTQNGVNFGDQYVVSWEDLENANANVLIYAIERVEKDLDAVIHPKETT